MIWIIRKTDWPECNTYPSALVWHTIGCNTYCYTYPSALVWHTIGCNTYPSSIVWHGVTHSVTHIRLLLYVILLGVTHTVTHTYPSGPLWHTTGCNTESNTYPSGTARSSISALNTRVLYNQPDQSGDESRGSYWCICLFVQAGALVLWEHWLTNITFRASCGTKNSASFAICALVLYRSQEQWERVLSWWEKLQMVQPLQMSCWCKLCKWCNLYRVAGEIWAMVGGWRSADLVPIAKSDLVQIAKAGADSQNLTVPMNTPTLLWRGCWWPHLEEDFILLKASTQWGRNFIFI